MKAKTANGEAAMNKILIVEDEALIREELQLLLSNAGFEAVCVTDFENTLACIRAEAPDLILLDINLPGQNGYSLCTAVRRQSEVPILFLTGRDTAMDELQALTLGGDDFIAKPCNVPILLARIHALLKRGQPVRWGEELRHNGVILRPAAGTLAVDGQETELTKTELKILYCLFTRAGEIVPRLDLVEYLWDSEIHIDDNTLSVHITRIREKLHRLGKDGWIQTRRGMGYKI